MITAKARRGTPLATAQPFYLHRVLTANARLALLDMPGIIFNNCAIYMTADDPSARMFRLFLPPEAQASGTRSTRSKFGCLPWLLHLRPSQSTVLEILSSA